MKITKRQLRQIIREQVSSTTWGTLNEDKIADKFFEEEISKLNDLQVKTFMQSVIDGDDSKQISDMVLALLMKGVEKDERARIISYVRERTPTPKKQQLFDKPLINMLKKSRGME